MRMAFSSDESVFAPMFHRSEFPLILSLLQRVETTDEKSRLTMVETCEKLQRLIDEDLKPKPKLRLVE